MWFSLNGVHRGAWKWLHRRRGQSLPAMNAAACAAESRSAFPHSPCFSHAGMPAQGSVASPFQIERH